MAGFESESKSANRYFIAEIINNHHESDFYSIMDEFIPEYFTRYSALSTKDTADFQLYFNLSKIKTTSAIKSATEQTVYATMTAHVNIRVVDQNGKTRFDKTLTSSESYESSSDLSANIDTRDSAFQRILNNILSDFKFEYENAQ